MPSRCHLYISPYGFPIVIQAAAWDHGAGNFAGEHQAPGTKPHEQAGGEASLTTVSVGGTEPGREVYGLAISFCFHEPVIAIVQPSGQHC